MSRIAFLNFSFGFFLILLSSMGGFFLATNLNEHYHLFHEYLSQFSFAILRSSHSHTNLFGIIHILFGLTVVYSKAPEKIKCLQTFGFFFGSITMSILMLCKNRLLTSDFLSSLDLVIGFGLSCFLLSLGSHFFCMTYRVVRI